MNKHNTASGNKNKEQTYISHYATAKEAGKEQEWITGIRDIWERGTWVDLWEWTQTEDAVTHADRHERAVIAVWALRNQVGKLAAKLVVSHMGEFYSTLQELLSRELICVICLLSLPNNSSWFSQLV